LELLALLTGISGVSCTVWLVIHKALGVALATLVGTAISVYLGLALASAITLLINLSTQMEAHQRAR
jgi:hypothetical protein